MQAREHDNERKKHIALGELEAIIMGVDLYTQPGNFVILATDSMTAKHWVENGDAKPIEARILLAKLDEMLTARSARLFLTYINTKLNVADRPSRVPIGDKALDEDALKATVLALRHAERESRGLWATSGNRTGGVRRGREEQ